MGTRNELIEVIDATRSRGAGIKSIRKQKYDPNHFYMSSTDGKSVGPVTVEGSNDEVNRKFGEAQSYLAAMRTSPVKPRQMA